MAIKRKTLSAIGGVADASTPKTRTPKTLSAEQQSLLATAEDQVKQARAKVKEAKALGKVIGCLGSLSKWGIDQLKLAIGKREVELDTPAPAPVETAGAAFDADESPN